MVGRTIIAVIMDEMAEMAGGSSMEPGTGLDYVLYGKLKPSIATFGMKGKMICISNPLGPTGRFYELYLNSFVDKTMLMFQMPTWVSNPVIDQAYLRSEQLKDPDNYSMHYGAEFGVTGSSPFIPASAIHIAFQKSPNRRRLECGYTQVQYFAHLDPAFSSNNYTLVVVHLEEIPNMVTSDGKPYREVIVDHMHIWRPRSGFPIDSNVVDSYIIQLSTQFKFAQISYDHWGSQGSIVKLKNYGLNVVQITFSRNYQNLIFSELYELFMNEKIDIYDVDTNYLDENNNMVALEESTECRKQLLTLQKHWRGNNTFKVEALPGNSDDFPDSLAAASYEALKFKAYQRLAKPKSVYTGYYMR
jgi:hypothetical protein